MNRNKLLSLLGKMPAKVELNLTVIEEVDCGTFVRKKISYASEMGVCKVVCVRGELHRKPPFIFNGKTIQGTLPISYWHRPFLRNIVNSQVNHLHRRFIGGEGTMIV
jgi:hypothetical protein